MGETRNRLTSEEIERCRKGNSVVKVWNLGADTGEVRSQAEAELHLVLSKDEQRAKAFALEGTNDTTGTVEPYSENLVVGKSVRSSRYGRFPFFRHGVIAPTPLDSLVLHTTVLDMASDVLFKESGDSINASHADAFPRLLDAHVVAAASENIGGSRPRNNDLYYQYSLIPTMRSTTRLPLDAVVIEICLSGTDSGSGDTADEQLMRISICRLDSKGILGPPSTTNETSQERPRTALRAIYACSAAQHLEAGNIAYVRYLEHAGKWISALLPHQRASLGFPPPGHHYWEKSQALAEVERRYHRFGMDMSPYRLGPTQQTSGAKTRNCTGVREIGEAPTPPEGVTTRHPYHTYKDPARLVKPETVRSLQDMRIDAGSNSILCDEQVSQFRKEGCLFVHGIWPDEVVDRASEAACRIWPCQPPPVPSLAAPWSPRRFAFPFEEMVLNEVSLHPRILSVVSQLLGVDVSSIRIAQSGCFAKRGVENETNGKETVTVKIDNDEPEMQEACGASNSQTTKDCSPPEIPIDPSTFVEGNQPIHHDFGSNTLLTPSRNALSWSDVEEVQGILFYDDHEMVGGGTAFVPGLDHSPMDAGYLGWLPDEMEKDDPRPALYAAERIAAYKRGSILLFQLGTWHRGTPVLPGKLRHVHHLCFRRADATWVGSCAEFGQPTVRSFRELENMGGLDLSLFFSSLNQGQRAVLGMLPDTDDFLESAPSNS